MGDPARRSRPRAHGTAALRNHIVPKQTCRSLQSHALPSVHSAPCHTALAHLPSSSYLRPSRRPLPRRTCAAHSACIHTYITRRTYRRQGTRAVTECTLAPCKAYEPMREPHSRFHAPDLHPHGIARAGDTGGVPRARAAPTCSAMRPASTMIWRSSTCSLAAQG
jgi:hypothetical protein